MNFGRLFARSKGQAPIVLAGGLALTGSFLLYPKSSVFMPQRAQGLKTAVFCDSQPRANELPPKTCVVIGAGVIGLTTAYFLAKRGVQVTIIDSNDAPGQGTSFANAGSLRRYSCDPVLSKESVKPAIKALFKGDDYLILSPSALLHGSFVRWGINFAVGCLQNNIDELRSAISSILSLSNSSLDEIIKDEKLDSSDLHFQTKGAIALYRTKDTLKVELEKHKESTGNILAKTADELAILEPSLEYQKDDYTGGVLFPSDRSADCYRFCNALSQILQQKYGVKFIFGEQVVGFNINEEDKLVDCIRTNEDRMVYADSFVVCCGHESPKLGSLVGDNITVYPMRGYSITYNAGENVPSHMLMDPSHIFVTPFGRKVRFAGIGEFTSINAPTNRHAIERLDTMSRTLFPKVADWNSPREVWIGRRPQTPDDLPIICRSGMSDNLFYNTGHGSRGWVMSAGSGKYLSWLICGKQEEETSGIPGGFFEATRFL